MDSNQEREEEGGGRGWGRREKGFRLLAVNRWLFTYSLDEICWLTIFLCLGKMGSCTPNPELDVVHFNTCDINGTCVKT